MAEKHLAKAIIRRFKRMPTGKRVDKIRKLASESQETREFIRSEFPELYQKAFSPRSSSGDGPSE